MSSVKYIQYGVPIAGAGVLGTYAWGLSQKVDKKRLWGGLKGKLKLYWGLTALATAVSFIYLYWLFGFGIDDDSFDYNSLIIAYIIFFVGAITWMPTTILHMKKSTRLNRGFVSSELWLTAVGSAMILHHANNLPDKEAEWKKILATTSGILMLIQHLFWDAIVWDNTFQ